MRKLARICSHGIVQLLDVWAERWANHLQDETKLLLRTLTTLLWIFLSRMVTTKCKLRPSWERISSWSSQNAYFWLAIFTNYENELHCKMLKRKDVENQFDLIKGNISSILFFYYYTSISEVQIVPISKKETNKANKSLLEKKPTTKRELFITILQTYVHGIHILLLA